MILSKQDVRCSWHQILFRNQSSFFNHDSKRQITVWLTKSFLSQIIKVFLCKVRGHTKCLEIWMWMWLHNKRRVDLRNIK